MSDARATVPFKEGRPRKPQERGRECQCSAQKRLLNAPSKPKPKAPGAMISIDLDALAKALAPLLAAELREKDRRQLAGPEPLIDQSGGGSSSPEDVIDRHSALQFGLTGRTFVRLAREGAFPCFALDERGRVGAFRRDIRAWLEQQKRPAVEKPKPPPLPLGETQSQPMPRSKNKSEATPLPQAASTHKLSDDDCDELIVRALEAGKFRVIPGRKKTNEPGRARSPKSRR